MDNAANTEAQIWMSLNTLQESVDTLNKETQELMQRHNSVLRPNPALTEAVPESKMDTVKEMDSTLRIKIDKINSDVRIIIGITREILDRSDL